MDKRAPKWATGCPENRVRWSFLRPLVNRNQPGKRTRGNLSSDAGQKYGLLMIVNGFSYNSGWTGRSRQRTTPLLEDHDPYRMAIGKRLAEARQRARLSKQHVTDELKRRRVKGRKNALHEWETGKRTPTAEVLGHLAEIYGASVDLDEVVGRPSGSPPGVPITLPQIHRAIKALVVKAQRLSDQEKGG